MNAADAELVRIIREAVIRSAPKRQWVGLTDAEVAEIERNSLHRSQAVRAIEAKLKEKNA